MIEEAPLTEAKSAVERMLSGQARVESTDRPARSGAARRAVRAAAAKGPSSERLAREFLTSLASSSERAKRKVSVTVDADLWDEVSRLVRDDAASTASSAVETALAMWAANQRLRELLDSIYADTPGARPAEDHVEAAAELLGLR